MEYKMRQKSEQPMTNVTIRIPAHVHERLKATLYSGIEDKVPFGAQSVFYTNAIIAALDRRSEGLPDRLDKVHKELEFLYLEQGQADIVNAELCDELATAMTAIEQLISILRKGNGN